MRLIKEDIMQIKEFNQDSSRYFMIASIHSPEERMYALLLRASDNEVVIANGFHEEDDTWDQGSYFGSGPAAFEAGFQTFCEMANQFEEEKRRNRYEEVKLMYQTVCCLNNEDAYYDRWLFLMPEEPEDEEFWDFAEEEHFNDLKKEFLEILTEYAGDGLYQAEGSVFSYARKFVPDIENLTRREDKEWLMKQKLREKAGQVVTAYFERMTEYGDEKVSQLYIKALAENLILEKDELETDNDILADTYSDQLDRMNQELSKKVQYITPAEVSLLFHHLTYEGKFQVLLDEEFSDTTGNEKLQSMLYEAYMESSHSSFFGHDLFDELSRKKWSWYRGHEKMKIEKTEAQSIEAE